MVAESSALLQHLLDLIAQDHNGIGVLVLFVSSLIEYIFPPFPGDAITLFGTYLVVKGLWSFPFALFLATTGSLFGAAADYGIGIWLGHRLDHLPSEKQIKRWTFLTREKYELVTDRFNRYGAIYIAINRFLPGIRAFFFVAAGAAHMRLWKVLFWAAVSALIWNSLILGLGYAVGSNWERLRSIMSTYTLIAWIVVGVMVVGVICFWLLRKRRRTSPPQ
jgi:membrane protein DedA with SNARE-associated domain